MKALFILLVISVGLSSASAQDQGSGEKKVSRTCVVAATDRAIRQIADQWKDAYNDGNAEKVASLYTPDAYYLTQHFVTGIVHGHQAIRAYVQLGVDAKYHIDSIEILATDCAGDFAYAVSRYKATNGDQKAMGVNLLILRKLAGKWKIVGHEAAVPDPATAVQHLDTE